MNKIIVDKTKLIDKLKENREWHRAEFEKAYEGYRKAMIATLEKNLEAVKNGNGKVEVHIGLVRPQDHTDDYDRAIQMLEWEQASTMELTLQEFTQFVQDDWGWKQQFTSTNASYIAN